MKNFLLTLLVYFLLFVNLAWIAIRCLVTWRNLKQEIDNFADNLISDEPTEN